MVGSIDIVSRFGEHIETESQLLAVVFICCGNFWSLNYLLQKRGTEVTLSMVLPVFRMGLPMARTLCELKKLLKSDFKTYKKFVCDPTHVCTKCGRTSNAKKLVCKPERLGK